jgi:glycoprotein-N-acetylgalactosamine 3-beta-galactosyltransferase
MFRYMKIRLIHTKKGLFLSLAVALVFTLFYIFEWHIDIKNSSRNKLASFLTPKVQLATKIRSESQIISSNQESKQKNKELFCLILTKTKSLGTRAKQAYDSWAKKCDKHVFMATLPDEFKLTNKDINEGIEAELESSLTVLQPPDFHKDKYSKITDKVFSTLKYMYKKYDDYEYYLKADDDTFIFVENLREFLREKNSSRIPLTYGYDFKQFVERGYHSGGAGYVLTNAAFTLLASKLTRNYSFCSISETGTEDIDVAKCLRKLSVYSASSLDENGRERFHPFTLDIHYFGEFTSPQYSWIYSMASNPVQKVSILNS